MRCLPPIVGLSFCLLFGPAATAPDAAEPDAVKPDAVKPDAVKPDAVKPDAVKPDAVKPDAVKPDAVKPDAVKPDAVKPDAVKIVPDVVYGHKLGLAMTFDVFQPPADANGAGVLFMVSGGWYSNWTEPEKLIGMFRPLLDEGFTVFAVRHGSSPKFSIPEAVEDVRRAVRYVRVNADRFGVDPQRLGVYGYSAGGHLSLMLGTASDEGDAKASDPVLHASDRVQAVVAAVAPTDLRIMVWTAPESLPAYKRFPAMDLPIADAAQVSPLLHVTADDAPTLLIAGDADELVPIKHSREIYAALQEKNVRSQLVELAGAGHGFRGDDAARATAEMVAWFVKYLAKP